MSLTFWFIVIFHFDIKDFICRLSFLMQCVCMCWCLPDLCVCVTGPSIPPVWCVSTGRTERLPAGAALSALLLQSMLGTALHCTGKRRHGSGWVLCVCVHLCSHQNWWCSGRVTLDLSLQVYVLLCVCVCSRFHQSFRLCFLTRPAEFVDWSLF